MKKVIPFLLVLSIIFGASACSKNKAEPVQTTTAPSPEQLSSYIGDGLLTVYRGLIDSAIYLSQNVYEFGSLECAADEPAVKQNGRSYHRVTSERFKNYALLKDYLESTYSAAVASQFISNGKYIDIDGVLYCDTSAYQANPSLSFNNYSFVPSDKTDSSCTLTVAVTLDGQPSQIILHAVNSGGDWRLDSSINSSNIIPDERSTTA